MNITDLTLIALQITGSNDAAGILLRILPGYEYQNGKRTDMQTHVKYEVVFPENNFEKVTVKVPGIKPVVSEEQLGLQKGKIKVKFKNLSGKFYRTNSGEYALTCSADGVEVIA